MSPRPRLGCSQRVVVLDPIAAGCDPPKLSTRSIIYRRRPHDADGKVKWLW